MPEIDDIDSTDDGQEGNAVQVLRKQNSKLAADLKAATEKIEAFAAKQKASDIAGILGELKASPKLAKYVSVDEVSKESVLAWLKEDGELFGWSEDGSAGTSTDGADGDGSGADDERATAARRISNVTNAARTAQSGAPTAQQLAEMPFSDAIARGLLVSD